MPDQGDNFDRPEGRPKVPIERQPESLLRLISLKTVTVEAHWHLRTSVWRFYSDLLGLGDPGVFVEPMGTLLLIFRNAGPDLLVRMTHSPDIWVNRPRAVLELPDLAHICMRLNDEGIEYQPITGWMWPDQRIGLWDPSGNRLELKRLWPLT